MWGTQFWSLTWRETFWERFVLTSYCYHTLSEKKEEKNMFQPTKLKAHECSSVSWMVQLSCGCGSWRGRPRSGRNPKSDGPKAKTMCCLWPKLILKLILPPRSKQLNFAILFAVFFWSWFSQDNTLPAGSDHSHWCHGRWYYAEVGPIL